MNKKASLLIEQIEQKPESEIAEADSPPKTYQLDANNLPVSWSLQLGSFRKKNNAIKLRRSLREASYRTYILAAETTEGQVFRVFVGPILSINKLKGFSADIESSFEMKGQIVRYRIEDDANQLGG